MSSPKSVVRSHMAPSSSKTTPRCAQVVEGGVDRAGSRPAPARSNQVSNSTPMLARLSPQVAHGPLVAPLDRVDVVGHLGRPLADVLALVAVLGELLPAFRADQRAAEDAHLHAAVVQVVLPVDDVAGALEDAGQRVAVGGPPPAAGVERTGRVGGDELDVDPPATAEVEARVAVLATGDHVDEDVVEPRLPEVEVDEPRAGDLDPLDVGRAARRRAARPGRRPAPGGRGRPPWPWPWPRWTTSRRARAGRAARGGSPRAARCPPRTRRRAGRRRGRHGSRSTHVTRAAIRPPDGSGGHEANTFVTRDHWR